MFNWSRVEFNHRDASQSRQRAFNLTQLITLVVDLIGARSRVKERITANFIIRKKKNIAQNDAYRKIKV